MDRQSNSDLKIRNGAVASLPPAMIGETGWDILLAVGANDDFGLGLDRLAALASVPPLILGQWLDWLEDRRLVAGRTDIFTDEFRAVITRAGRELLDNYLLATSSLQGRARH